MFSMKNPYKLGKYDAVLTHSDIYDLTLSLSAISRLKLKILEIIDWKFDDSWLEIQCNKYWNIVNLIWGGNSSLDSIVSAIEE